MLDFLGIGVPKAGTTYLFRMLAMHPEVYFPLGKECHYWNTSKSEHNGLHRHYLRAFRQTDFADANVWRDPIGRIWSVIQRRMKITADNFEFRDRSEVLSRGERQIARIKSAGAPSSTSTRCATRICWTTPRPFSMGCAAIWASRTLFTDSFQGTF